MWGNILAFRWRNTMTAVDDPLTVGDDVRCDRPRGLRGRCADLVGGCLLVSRWIYPSAWGRGVATTV